MFTSLFKSMCLSTRALAPLLLVLISGSASAEDTALRGDVRVKPTISWEASPFAVSSLLLELESALGSDHRREVQKRLDQIEEELLPTFKAIHKNEYGNLGQTGVRYILHRYFMQKYSWIVKGLDTAGQAWNISSPVELLRNHVPEGVLISFEKRLGSHGFGVRDAAALAATLETLIQMEAVVTVKALYKVHGLSSNGNATADEVDEMLDTYLAAHIVQVNLSNIADFDKAVLQGNSSAMNQMFGVSVTDPVQTNGLSWKKWRADLQTDIAQIYPAWPKTQNFMREVRKRSQTGDNAFPFSSVMGIVGQVLDEWGRWRNHECQHTKQMLLNIEDRTTGCVRLADFYRSMTEKGVWQFGESVKYLREQGILEESMPGDPHVIVPNYLTSQGNCLSTSQYYSTCCLNECEEILDSLEMQFSAPYATPSEIVAKVVLLPSASVPAHRILSADLLQKLDEIALSHGGRIPLHGRLFQQWMHHAYPRECPYPHLSGTTHQRTLWDMQDKTVVQSSVFTERQAKEVISLLPNQSQVVGSSAIEGTCVPWHHVEELIVHPHAAMQSLADLENEQAVWTAMTFMAMISVSATMMVGLMRLLRDVKRSASIEANLPKMEV